MDSDPRRKLDANKEGWLALGVSEGGSFAARAASELLSGLPSLPGCSRECQYWVLRSAMAREDREACRVFINDWSKPATRSAVVVSRFVPGQHYHVLHTKFDTLAEAQQYLRDRGYVYGGLVEKHVYQPE